MHLQATAGLLGLRDFGGKLTTGKPYWPHLGAKFGHFVGDVKAESGYGRSCCSYMSGVVRPCCWICVPKCSPPEALASYVGPIWGSSARIKATFWAQTRAKFGHFGPC